MGVDIYKPHWAFYTDKSQSDGLSVQCKDCKRRLQKKYYKARKEAKEENYRRSTAFKDAQAKKTITVKTVSGELLELTEEQFQKMMLPMPAISTCSESLDLEADLDLALELEPELGIEPELEIETEIEPEIETAVESEVSGYDNPAGSMEV